MCRGVSKFSRRITTIGCEDLDEKDRELADLEQEG